MLMIRLCFAVLLMFFSFLSYGYRPHFTQRLVYEELRADIYDQAQAASSSRKRAKLMQQYADTALPDPYPKDYHPSKVQRKLLDKANKLDQKNSERFKDGVKTLYKDIQQVHQKIYPLIEQLYVLNLEIYLQEHLLKEGIPATKKQEQQRQKLIDSIQKQGDIIYHRFYAMTVFDASFKGDPVFKQISKRMNIPALFKQLSPKAKSYLLGAYQADDCIKFMEGCLYEQYPTADIESLPEIFKEKTINRIQKAGTDHPDYADYQNLDGSKLRAIKQAEWQDVIEIYQDLFNQELQKFIQKEGVDAMSGGKVYLTKNVIFDAMALHVEVSKALGQSGVRNDFIRDTESLKEEGGGIGPDAMEQRYPNNIDPKVDLYGAGTYNNLHGGIKELANDSMWDVIIQDQNIDTSAYAPSDYYTQPARLAIQERADQAAEDLADGTAHTEAGKEYQERGEQKAVDRTEAYKDAIKHYYGNVCSTRDRYLKTLNEYAGSLVIGQLSDISTSIYENQLFYKEGLMLDLVGNCALLQAALLGDDYIVDAFEEYNRFKKVVERAQGGMILLSAIPSLKVLRILSGGAAAVVKSSFSSGLNKIIESKLTNKIFQSAAYVGGSMLTEGLGNMTTQATQNVINQVKTAGSSNAGGVTPQGEGDNPAAQYYSMPQILPDLNLERVQRIYNHITPELVDGIRASLVVKADATFNEILEPIKADVDSASVVPLVQHKSS